jgi:hypothetical protein
MRLAIHGEDSEPSLFIGQGWASIAVEGPGQRIVPPMAMNEEKASAITTADLMRKSG